MKLYVFGLLACFHVFASTIVWEDETFIKVGKGLYTREEAKAYAKSLSVIKCYKKDSVLSINFSDGWKILLDDQWDLQVKNLKKDQTKLAPVVTLFRLIEYSKKFKPEQKRISTAINKMKNSSCWPKEYKEDEFFYLNMRELVELETYLDDKYFGTNDQARGTKSLQVLIETLSNQLSYEFYNF
jgi:hypothetical protein